MAIRRSAVSKSQTPQVWVFCWAASLGRPMRALAGSAVRSRTLGALALVLAGRLRLDRPGAPILVDERASADPRPGWPPDAGDGDRRAPVGRRGQGQDDRLPGRAGRDGRALPGWRQRRPHGRQRRRGLQAPADAVGRALPAHHLGHRQRGRGQPGHAHHRARHAHRARDRRRARPGQPQRARDHAVPRRARPGQRGPPRRRPRSGRRAAASGRPTATGRGGSACAWRTCSTRAVLRERLERVAARQEPAPRRDGPATRSRSTRSSTQALALGRAPPAPPRRHDLARPGCPRRAASTCCSRAPRARCSTSTTAATRS